MRKNLATTASEEQWAGFWPACGGLLLLSACLLQYLPRDYALLAVYWVSLSLSVGIAFGHGVLSEPWVSIRDRCP